MTKLAHSKEHGLFKYLLPTCAFLLAMTVSCWGQAGDGSLVGTVRDPSGAVVANATVDIVEAATHTTYSTVTTSDGRFVFPEAKVGNYTVTVTTPGFKVAVQSGVTISVASTAKLDVNLQVGQASQSVVVNADALQIQTESSQVGQTVSTQLVSQLPLNFTGLVRSPLQFVQLTPGFAGDPTGNPASQAGFKLSGAPTGGSDIILDGASIQQASPEVEMNFGISSDAVGEFNVLTSTFPAQYGRATGGIVDLSSKSGTNDIHGGVYDILRNAAFDANTWNNNHFGNKKPFDTQNDFGGFAGGPVRIPWLYDGRDKTFWFFAYEGFRFKSGGQSTQSIPTPAMWSGDFSALLNGGVPLNINGITYQPKQLYDYATCSGPNLGNPCQPFVNNQIPISRLDPLSKSFIPYLPTAQVTTQPYQNEKNTTLDPTNDDLYSFRFDQNIKTNQKFSAGFYHAHMPVEHTNVTFGPLYTLDFGTTISDYLRLNYDWSITPTILNHLNFGYTRDHRTEASPNTIGQWADKLGWHGGLVDATIPTFSIQYDALSPPTDYGGGGTLPYPPANANLFFNNSYDFEEDLSWIHGKHNFKFGGQARLQELNTTNGTGSAGGFGYNTVLTSAGTNAQGKPIDLNSGSGAASFFLGAASTAGIGGFLTAEARIHYYGMYVQDDWKVTPKLTLNLGFRYEIPEPAYEAHAETSQVNENLPNPGADGLPGAMEFQGTGTGRDGKSRPQSTWWHSFGPRVGLAYQLDDLTVVRAAYGLYYGGLKISNFANHESQGFFSTGYAYPTQQNQQTVAAIPSQITSYPGIIPPFIDPTVANGQGPQFLISRVGLPPRVQNWTLDIQRQLPGQWLFDIAYVGAHGDRIQLFQKDPNLPALSEISRGPCLSVLLAKQASSAACAGQAPVPVPFSNFQHLWGGGATVAQALRPFPQYGSPTLSNMYSANPFGNYTYNALQVRLIKRYGSGLTVLSNYTWSKALTNADSDLAGEAGWNGGTTGTLNPYNPGAEKSYSEFDAPSVAKIAYTYELPFGKSKKYLSNSNKVVTAVASNWLIGGFLQYASGTPLNVVNAGGWTSGIFANNATGGLPRPNVVSGHNSNGYHGGGWVFGQSRRFSPDAFTIAPNYTFGNAPRLLGNVRNFAQKDEDVQIGKKIPLWTERVNLNFRFDVFNLFNRHSWGCFNNVVGSPTFGQSQCGTGPLTTVNNNIPAAGQSRNMAANFRITF